MNQKTFDKWMQVLNKSEMKNKQMLSNKKITPEAYSILNKINADKYEKIIAEYHRETLKYYPL